MTFGEFHNTIRDMICDNFYDQDIQIYRIFGRRFAEDFESTANYFYEEKNHYWTKFDEIEENFEKQKNDKLPF